MPHITISLPTDLEQFVTRDNKKYFQKIARDSIINYIKKLELTESIIKMSKLTDEDSVEIGKEIKKSIARRYNK